jgi:hypothetical protein
MKITTINTCATCYYFNHKPRLVNGETMPVGCCLAVEFVTSLEPVTGKVKKSRPVTAVDPSCDEFLTEQEFLLHNARQPAALAPQEPAA